MPQFARPTSDVTIDNWETQSAGVANLYLTIDEVTADDTDYIRTQLTPSNDVYVTKLSSVTDPASSTGHILSYRYGKDSSGGDQIDQTVQLRQSYSGEGAVGTLIFSAAHADVGVFPQAAQTTLSAGAADTITNYGDLYLRIVGNKP